jgi:molybdopterin synthase catalytic subunit
MKKNETMVIEIQDDSLNLLKASNFITHPEAGAANFFIGTTRNHHDEKKSSNFFTTATGERR